MNRAQVTAVLLILAGALTGAVVFEGGPNRVVFPTQDIPIYFNHDYHVAKDGEGLSCDFCHENVSTSSRSSGRDIPGHAACESCHAEWIGDDKAPAPAELCSKCHTDPTVAERQNARAKVVLPDPNINFAHKTHVDAGFACVECHTQVPSKTVATRDDFPTMDKCIACHEAKGAGTECTVCHLALPSGRMQINFNSGNLMPDRLHQFAIHDADFLRDHSAAVRRDRAYCNNCHGEDFCLQCHDGVARDVRYHPGDFISQHMIRAKKDDMRCQSCHRVQTFCLDCHVRSGVATVNPGATVARSIDQHQRRTIRRNGLPDGLSGDANIAVGPHPMSADGWNSPASKNFHGFFVQRNARSCAGCHQEQFCVTCHGAFQGSQFNPATFARPGGNPHGPLTEKLRGSTAQKRSARMCLKCHSPFDPSWR